VVINTKLWDFRKTDQLKGEELLITETRIVGIEQEECGFMAKARYETEDVCIIDRLAKKTNQNKICSHATGVSSLVKTNDNELISASCHEVDNNDIEENLTFSFHLSSKPYDQFLAGGRLINTKFLLKVDQGRPQLF
jgi:hypothetical protein